MTDAETASRLSKLSRQQKAILAVLPEAGDGPRGNGVKVRDIFQRLGVPQPSSSERACMSRALARLEARGLVQLWQSYLRQPGKGGWWARTSGQR